MNVTVAIVRAVDGDDALVELASTGCGRCNEPGGCGGAAKADLACRGPRHYRVQNSIGARVGDSVNISVNDGAVARSASLAYVLPLASLFAGAFSGNLLLDPTVGDAGAVMGATAGLLLGWFGLHRIRIRRADQLSPRIVAKS